MTNDTTRRTVLAGVLAAGVGGLALTDAHDLLDQFAPLSGDAWDAADRTLPGTVESPHGEASIHYDEFGVPTISADDEEAAYFAVGYAQAFDRLFQLDLQRRVMRGQVSELVGEAMLEDDEFHVAMDFAGAAEATWEHVADTPAGPLVQAYTDGVNAVIENEQLPLEFELLGAEPEPWTPVDSMLMEKQISWDLTGNFGELREALIAERLGDDVVAELYPDRLDHDVPILREEIDADRLDENGEGDTGDSESAGNSSVSTATAPRSDSVGSASNSSPEDSETDTTTTASIGPALTSWLSGFESPPGVGSNSWVVSGDHTESGLPIVAYDPHLTLMTPPLWYEQHVETPNTSVRGATFPGVPFVITGANDSGTWSFTNVGADVLDCYEYDIDEDGERYRYQGEWRDFDTEEREIAVAGGENRTLTLRKTVHGPVLEREGQTVGVAWTGHTATRTTDAIYEFERSDGLDEVLESTRKFDLPTQNLVYADADGRTMYYATGKLPIREIDGEPVSGNQIFDGSAGEGEWEGFTPFGESSWDGFVPFEEKPHAIDPDVLATANQRVADDPEHYVGVAYAAPYRGERIYDRLDEQLERGEPTDLDFHRELQNDTYDGRAAQLVPDLLDALAESNTDEFGDVFDTLEDWDYRMDRDSRGALVFARWFDHYRHRLFEDGFEDAGLDESYYPNDWIIATLPEDSEVFDDQSKAEAMLGALENARSEIDAEGWETYGDWNSTRTIEHPFAVEAPFLDYETAPTDGSRATVKNYRVESAVGASWRMVVEPGGDATAVLPGGNSGDYFSPHYDDQFDQWRNGEQKPMDRTTGDGEPDVSFVAEGDQ
ncbi:peptidase S45 family protein [Natrialba magadii ATCC 43099]|uniref:Peptidase S45 family protein n=1 Tax=Natrialba magadii (strain ATCC 43099 / DSM 3394 / CCM 3739 / CIP 104546 / IAM 13178 / JCM 8861 / NBRC 102185 / NCIMB 2190 / MS3) TaxID=547559 RepID=D3SSR5_NATMM|nr:penicillin acylase family protein [Natrialba magadii]ADD06910.1 peptidase S45 family protein [Natrialba magadii ATCC 43099]ELY28465.1 peptidase S45 penicillin amidase [Natrialba magadii ATCC 43099]